MQRETQLRCQGDSVEIRGDTSGEGGTHLVQQAREVPNLVSQTKTGGRFSSLQHLKAGRNSREPLLVPNLARSLRHGPQRRKESIATGSEGKHDHWAGSYASQKIGNIRFNDHSG